MRNKLLDYKNDFLYGNNLTVYHIKMILTVFAVLPLMLFNTFTLYLIEGIQKVDPLLQFMLLFILSAIYISINSLLLFCTVKRIVSSLKNIHLFLPLIQLIFCFYIVLFLIIIYSNLFFVIFPHNMFFEFYRYSLKDNIFNLLYVLIKFYGILVILIAISLLLNSFLPKALQKTDVSLKKRSLRVFIKLSFIIITAVLSFIFVKVDKTNFSALSILTTMFTFICTPKTIIHVFAEDSLVDWTTHNISGAILAKFDRIKFLYYLFIFSWSISIYFFETTLANEKVIHFSLCFVPMVTVEAFLSAFGNKTKKRLFSKWLVPKNDAIDR